MRRCTIRAMGILTKVTSGSGLRRTRLLLWAKYSAASVVATVISQAAFALCYWFGTAALVALAGRLGDRHRAELPDEPPLDLGPPQPGRPGSVALRNHPW